MNKIMSAIGGSASGGKKILISLAMIAAVGAIVVGATTAYFSDTETSGGNTLSAGTIDIDIDGKNPWAEHFDLGDLKPSETGYINFRINNVGQNPVNISKTLKNIVGNGGIERYPCFDEQEKEYLASSEPECEAEQALKEREDDIQEVIIYDLSVEVYNSNNGKIWWQTIYSDDEGESIADVYGEGGGTPVKLGMIPVGGYMLVTQSYHLSGSADNEYQGDGLTFNIEIKGDQLNQPSGATVTLEDKTGPTEWNIIENDINGILTYQTKGSKFEYSFTGKAPLINHNYVLAVSYNASTDVNKEIGTGMTNEYGNITISGSVDTGDLTNAKAWLVPADNWTTGTGMNWSGGAGWPGMVAQTLWETGLINYDQN